MKRCVILMLFALIVIISGCTKSDSQITEKELSKEEQISQKVEEQKEEMSGKIEASGDDQLVKENDTINNNAAAIMNTSDSNDKDNISDYRLSTPDTYTRVNHNDHIYVYDTKGNSLNVSIQSQSIKVDEYSKENYHQLISSSYKDVKLQDLQHTTLDGLKALYIEYTGKKNDKNYINCRYYVENGENTILIDLQAIDEANCKVLKSAVEEIKF